MVTYARERGDGADRSFVRVLLLRGRMQVCDLAVSCNLSSTWGKIIYDLGSAQTAPSCANAGVLCLGISHIFTATRGAVYSFMRLLLLCVCVQGRGAQSHRLWVGAFAESTLDVKSGWRRRRTCTLEAA
jgi:hypothetical protein